MKEINYKPSLLDSHITLTSENCTCELIRVNLFRFLLREPVTLSLIFAFDSKCLGDYFDLHPNILAIDLQFIQIHPIEGDVSSSKELRLKLSHGEKILLNERDEIFALKLFKGAGCSQSESLFTPEEVWGIPDEGFFSLILMTNRFAAVIENYSPTQGQKQVLMRFWLDYRFATSNPFNDFSGNPPHLIRGEFTSFFVTPRKDGTVKFDLPPTGSNANQ